MQNRTLILAGLILFLATSTFSQVKSDSAEFKVMLERISKNKEFKDTLTSPLLREDIPGFISLSYYDYNPNYRVQAILKRNPNPRVFKMRTTTDRRPEYRTLGEVQFKLEGKDHTLQVFQRVEPIRQPGYDKYLFLPFTDETSGRETYGGGRFLDVFIPESDTLYLDFNSAYNPYCAYNHKYSCPIPPEENDLEVKIPVGEKPYKN